MTASLAISGPEHTLLGMSDNERLPDETVEVPIVVVDDASNAADADDAENQREKQQAAAEEHAALVRERGELLGKI